MSVSENVKLGVATLAAAAVVTSCKTRSSTSAGGPPNTSALASISVGDVPQDVVRHENQRVWVSVNGGEEQSYTGKAGRKELAQKSFTAGDKVVIQMALYGPELREGAIVAQTKEGDDSECPPKELELAAGSNNPTVRLCKADEDGNVDETDERNVVEAKPADLKIDACVAGENCEEDAQAQSGGSQQVQGKPSLKSEEIWRVGDLAAKDSTCKEMVELSEDFGYTRVWYTFETVEDVNRIDVDVRRICGVDRDNGQVKLTCGDLTETFALKTAWDQNFRLEQGVAAGTDCSISFEAGYIDGENTTADNSDDVDDFGVYGIRVTTDHEAALDGGNWRQDD